MKTDIADADEALQATLSVIFGADGKGELNLPTHLRGVMVAVPG